MSYAEGLTLPLVLTGALGIYLLWRGRDQSLVLLDDGSLPVVPALENLYPPDAPSCARFRPYKLGTKMAMSTIQLLNHNVLTSIAD